jgi:flavin-dependent thymidylate synthase
MDNVDQKPCGQFHTHVAHTWKSLDSLALNYRCHGAMDGKLNYHPDTEKVKVEENRALPVRWADRAMFQAEPITPEDGPKVYLLSMSQDPLGEIASTCKMYKGEVVRSLSEVTDEERYYYLQQVSKTKLKAPFEFVKFHFLLEGVTRAFTHQLVRQRTAAYAQESMRFAVPTGEDTSLPVGLPPSLSGLPEEDPRVRAWQNTVDEIEDGYKYLVASGVPAEDARGLLPTNILTRVHYTTDLRALLDHAGNRLCTQAQFEWRLVFAQIVKAIYDAELGDSGPIDVVGSPGYVKMSRELAELFRPVCYATGKCEFNADFDRPCSIRERVTAFHASGVPSDQWHSDHNFPPGQAMSAPLMPIKPGEWLLDHTAARQK